jgi:hypothetical protein
LRFAVKNGVGKGVNVFVTDFLGVFICDFATACFAALFNHQGNSFF